MKYFDLDDVINLKETFDNDVLNKIDENNLIRCYKYLIDEKIYFAKDMIIEYIDIFLIDYFEFKIKFQKLKDDLGAHYIEKLEEDISIIENYFYN